MSLILKCPKCDNFCYPIVTRTSGQNVARCRKSGCRSYIKCLPASEFEKWKESWKDIEIGPEVSVTDLDIGAIFLTVRGMEAFKSDPNFIGNCLLPFMGGLYVMVKSMPITAVFTTREVIIYEE